MDQPPKSFQVGVQCNRRSEQSAEYKPRYRRCNFKLAQMTHLVQPLSGLHCWAPDAFVNSLGDTVDGPVIIVGHALAALVNISGNLLRLSFEGVRVTCFDSVNCLVGESVRTNDERRKANLDRLGILVCGDRKLLRSDIRSARVRIGCQGFVYGVQRTRDERNRAEACQDGDFWCIILGLCGGCGHCGRRWAVVVMVMVVQKGERDDKNVFARSLLIPPCTHSVSHVIIHKHVIKILAKSGSHSKFYILYLIDIMIALSDRRYESSCVDSTSIRLHSKDTLNFFDL